MRVRPGFALLLSLLLVMALAAVGLGVTSIGVRERWIAAAAQRHRQARAHVEAAALEVVADWSTAAFARLEPGDALPLPSPFPGATVRVVRLDSALLAVHSSWTEPRPEAPAASARAAILVRTVNARAVASAFPAAAVAAGRASLQGGTVSGMDGCGPAVAGVRAPEIEDTGGALLLGSPPKVAAAPPTDPALDLLGPATAPRIATVTTRSAVITPRSGTDGETCLDGSWGVPEPGHPCHALRPLIHAAGPLTLSGGSARAILVVDGDLRLEAGVRFEGLILVRGTLEVDEDSRVTGAVRADTLVVRSGILRRSRCTVLDLLGGPALDRAFRPPGRWWLPAF